MTDVDPGLIAWTALALAAASIPLSWRSRRAMRREMSALESRATARQGTCRAGLQEMNARLDALGAAVDAVKCCSMARSHSVEAALERIAASQRGRERREVEAAAAQRRMMEAALAASENRVAALAARLSEIERCAGSQGQVARLETRLSTLEKRDREGSREPPGRSPADDDPREERVPAAFVEPPTGLVSGDDRSLHMAAERGRALRLAVPSPRPDVVSVISAGAMPGSLRGQSE